MKENPYTQQTSPRTRRVNNIKLGMVLGGIVAVIAVLYSEVRDWIGGPRNEQDNASDDDHGGDTDASV